MACVGVGVFGVQGASWHRADPGLGWSLMLSVSSKRLRLRVLLHGAGIANISMVSYAVFSARGWHDEDVL